VSCDGASHETLDSAEVWRPRFETVKVAVYGWPQAAAAMLSTMLDARSA